MVVLVMVIIVITIVIVSIVIIVIIVIIILIKAVIAVIVVTIEITIIILGSTPDRSLSEKLARGLVFSTSFGPSRSPRGWFLFITFNEG